MKKIKKYIDKAKKLNPLKNKVVLDGVNIKWKIKPSWKKDKCKATIEISKSIDNVDFYAVVNGKPFLIAEQEIGMNSDPEAANIFSANFKVTMNF